MLLLAFAALLIAVLLRHAANAVHDHTPLSQGASFVAVLLAVVAALAAFAFALGPRIVQEGIRIAEIVPGTLQDFAAWPRDRSWG